MKPFFQGDLSHHLDTLISQMRQEVQGEDRQRLLSVNETQYVEYLVDRYSVTPPALHPDRMEASHSEQPVPAEWHPGGWNVQRGRSYPRQVITYHLPFTGDAQLLALRPSTFITTCDEAGLDARAGTLTFDHIVWERVEPIKGEMDQILSRLNSMLTYVTRDIELHNRTVQDLAPKIVRARKDQHLQQANILASLGVPIRSADNVPSTFSVPVARTKPIIRKPAASSEPFAPEPTLDEGVYRSILEHCRNIGREMERHPSLYQGKGEEALRDLFLLMLSPHFDSASGEAFNKKGKTDILIRHDKANVFVAECKFWGGAKAFLATIDQALGYLTWRDSKAAVLLFNQNQRHAPVLDEIPVQVPHHPCFVKERGKVEDGWYGYEFHLPGDPTRGLQLAVLCFHLP